MSQEKNSEAREQVRTVCPIDRMVVLGSVRTERRIGLDRSIGPTAPLSKGRSAEGPMDRSSAHCPSRRRQMSLPTANLARDLSGGGRVRGGILLSGERRLIELTPLQQGVDQPNQLPRGQDQRPFVRVGPSLTILRFIVGAS